MNFLERAIRNGVSKAVGNAVEQGVRKAVQPAVNQAANNLANAAAQNINQSAKAINDASQAMNQAGSQMNSAEVANAFSALENMAVNFAKDKKICLQCGGMGKADEEFCPTCGAKLPTMTLEQGALCSNCGKQNEIGKNFCTGCGTKLPAKVAEEAAAEAANAAVMQLWAERLPQYPKWTGGGSQYTLEEFEDNDVPTMRFYVENEKGLNLAAYLAVLQQNGFMPTDKERNMFRKTIDGMDYYFDLTYGQGSGFAEYLLYAKKH